jgi:hypothetical protein
MGQPVLPYGAMRPMGGIMSSVPSVGAAMGMMPQGAGYKHSLSAEGDETMGRGEPYYDEVGQAGRKKSRVSLLTHLFELIFFFAISAGEPGIRCFSTQKSYPTESALPCLRCHRYARMAAGT